MDFIIKKHTISNKTSPFFAQITLMLKRSSVSLADLGFIINNAH